MCAIKLPSNIVFTSDGALLLLWCYVNIHSQQYFPVVKRSILSGVMWCERILNDCWFELSEFL